MYKCAVLLAAGEGQRMKSNTPKVLHKVCGKEMVNHVVDIVRSAGLSEVDVIISKDSEAVQESTKTRNVQYSYQEDQLGTGHAVWSAIDFLEGKKGIVAVFCGDTPLIRESTVKELMSFHEREECSAVILTSICENPDGYGRIIRTDGEVEKIIEQKDCSENQLNIKEVNSGIYSFDIESLLRALSSLNNDNTHQEYYLTDIIGILRSEGKKVSTLTVDMEEVLEVNSRTELAKAEAIMRERINSRHMDNGVTLIDAKSTYIDCEVIVEADAIIYPGNVLQGHTVIKSGTILYPNNRIEDSIIGCGCTVQSSVILESNVGNDTSIGPFAYIRPDSNIGSNVKIGDFVEIKKSTIGDNTKVSHLTYIGDAEIGSECNFGCGTITVNYDGKKKYKTIVGDNVFIGCNTNLVAPVQVKNNSYIAAGSTITEEVPEGALAIARARQINKEGWVQKKNSKK